MNKIIFCDKNQELVDKVKEVFNNEENKTHCELIVSDKNDVFYCKQDYSDALIVTASNPEFNAGGGLDLALAKKYPKQWKNAREFQFEKDLFFTISCDKNIKATRSIIKRALLGVYFASRKNDIILTGLGTSIAGLSVEDFIEELKLFVNAYFRYANFSNANFSDANFRCANFYNANFSDANFSDANFSDADFRYADFSDADFRYANFSDADFSDADFRYAYFSNANFSDANFSNANFSNVHYNFRITPVEGSFIGWKKVRGNLIVKLKITDAKHSVGGMIGRKCRCRSAKVIEIQNIDGTKSDETIAYSGHDESFCYKVGKTVVVKDWNDKPYLECEKGIHFFITRDEAVEWVI